MRLLILIAVTGFVGWVIWSISRQRFTFEVRVTDGIPQVVRGNVSPGFLQDINEVCARHGVRDGLVRGVARGQRTALCFSSEMPAPCQQQLRNIWALSPRMSTVPARRPKPS
jgi:hypothetical protein